MFLGRRRLRLWFVLALYLALLGLSHFVERGRRSSPPTGPESIGLAAIRGEERLAARVQMSWGEWGSRHRDSEPVVLLHGSPGGLRDFRRLAPALAGGRWLLAPDLPGFGASSGELPDYSILAHAGYVRDWLHEVGVDRFHLVGFSMGGGVALELARMVPQRVTSLALVSSIGVQEMELLGNYRLDHLLHGLQVGALWLLQEAVPHMGLLSELPLDYAYARNFYDSDQRPLRGILSRLEMPVLIVHGSEDFLVPREAALEHHRIVPHSELLMLDANHFFVFTQEPDIAPSLGEFWNRVERGEAPDRSRAEAARLRLAEAPFDPLDAPRWKGPALLVMMALLATATLISEDLTCIGAGLLVAEGRLPFSSAAIACAVGIFVGDVLMFWAGRWLGRPALALPPLKWWLREEAVARSSAWFRRRGGIVIMISRFMPGTRLATYFAAGLLRTSFWHFAFYMAIAVAIWAPLLVLSSRIAGAAALDHLETLRQNLLLFLVVGVVVFALLIRIVPRLFTWRGRRELVGLWRRSTRWEFWPSWLFYPPVVLHILALGVRFRDLTVFTAANPGMPDAGFIGESKAEILSSFGGTEGEIPLWRLIPPGDAETRLACFRAFLDQRGVRFPVVLKPDHGQRGQGVEVVSGEDEAVEYFRDHSLPTLVQEYVGGLEFGVFYYRFPGRQGEVLSITEKRQPVVVGDGSTCLEDLILRDPRAVAIADVYRRELEGRLSDVPAAGERVELTAIGAHSRGTLFLDGSAHCTPELVAAVDRLSRCFEGFYFGRFDFRVPELEDLKRGRNLKILELNGVTAESTDIYDPRNGVFRAWSKLRDQWRLAFEIGAACQKRGAEVTSASGLLKTIWRYRNQLP